jgi:hypothetical protein
VLVAAAVVVEMRMSHQMVVVGARLDLVAPSFDS